MGKCLAVRILPAALIVALTAGAFAADRAVTVTWDPPAVYAGPGEDCSVPGAAIGPDDLARLQYQLRWRVGATGQWTVATTTQTVYQIEGVPAGSELTVEVGAYLPGGSVLCWATSTITVPVAPVGPCQRLRLSVE